MNDELVNIMIQLGKLSESIEDEYYLRCSQSIKEFPWGMKHCERELPSSLKYLGKQ